MAWNDFYKERESLHYGGEMYKKAVIRYLQTQGYYLLSSSSQEGHLSDLKMSQKDKPNLWVEAKGTKVSIFEKAFKNQILDYFCKWLELPKDKQFDFSIFVEDFARIEETKEIISSTAVKEKTKSWFYNDYEELLKIHQIEIIKKSDQKDIFEFFHNINVNRVNGYILDETVNEREKQLEKVPFFSINNLYSELKSRRNPINEKSTIIVNFMPLSYPAKYFEFKSKYKKKGNLRNFFQNQGIYRHPAFSFATFEGKDSIVRTFDENVDLFKSLAKSEIKVKKTSNLEYIKLNQLVREHLNRFLWCKGLKEHRFDYYFPYKNLSVISLEDNRPLLIRGPRKPKEVTKVRFKDGKFNFVEHHALNIKIGLINDQLGCYIWPRFLFTTDGYQRITGDVAKNLSKFYLNPKYTRNSNKRSEIFFWEHFLTSANFFKEPDEWIKDFRIGNLDRLDVGWSSKSVPKGQHILTNFLDEN